MSNKELGRGVEAIEVVAAARNTHRMVESGVDHPEHCPGVAGELWSSASMAVHYQTAEKDRLQAFAKRLEPTGFTAETYCYRCLESHLGHHSRVQWIIGFRILVA